jgi:hypothetical protein
MYTINIVTLKNKSLERKRMGGGGGLKYIQLSQTCLTLTELFKSQLIEILRNCAIQFVQ